MRDTSPDRPRIGGAAIDPDARPGNERGTRRQQEHDGGRDLRFRTEAIERNFPGYLLLDVFPVPGIIRIQAARGDRARRYRIDPDAGWRPFAGRAFGERPAAA